jgi:hypothetical protein
VKLSQVKTSTQTATSASGLDSAIQTFILAHPTATFIDIQYQIDFKSDHSAKEYTALIAYTE